MPDVARFNGGPYDGKLCGVSIWPPPSEITELDGGIYLLTNWSKLTDEQASHPNIARGCDYEWRANA